MTTASRHEPDAFPVDPAASLVRSLRTPLDALRASIEALGHDFDPDDPRVLVLEGALAEIRRVASCVDELVDFSSEDEPRPLSCSVEEIVRAVRAQVPAEERERVVLARVDCGRPIWVDGPRLVRALRRLVENALEASDEDVLLLARQSRSGTAFCVADHDPSTRFDLRAADRAFASRKPDHLGLGLTLAKRDVESMGGTIDGHVTPRGDTWLRVRVAAGATAAEGRP